jgi:hypothetical protein
MSSFVKSKKKRKKTLIILALLNPIFGVGFLGIHHWYLRDAKKTFINFFLSMAYLFLVLIYAFTSDPTSELPAALFLVYVMPTMFELIMITFFPNSKYYADIDWVEPT